jgi:hypothetical protein
MYEYDDLTTEDLTADDVQRIAAGATMQTLQAIAQSTALAESAKQAALASAEEAMPGFLKLYSNPEVCKQMMEKRPRISRAIIAAENGQGSDYLEELYRVFYNTARGLVEAAEKPSIPSEETVSGSLATSASRQRVI